MANPPLKLFVFAAILSEGIQVSVAQSCEQTYSPPFVCDHEPSQTYTREGGKFSTYCGGGGHVDCSPCLKLIVGCCQGNFGIELSGFQLGSLIIIWRCVTSDNATIEGKHMHTIHNNGDEDLTIPATDDYSSCIFGACYHTVEGWTYIANLTTCSKSATECFRLTKKPSIEITTEEHLKNTFFELTTPKLRRKLNLSVITEENLKNNSFESTTSKFQRRLNLTAITEEHLKNNSFELTTSKFQRKSNLSTIIVPTVILSTVAALLIIVVIVGCYIIRKNHRITSHGHWMVEYHAKNPWGESSCNIKDFSDSKEPKDQMSSSKGKRTAC